MVITITWLLFSLAPHLPNYSPTIVLSVLLGNHFNKKTSIGLIVLLSLITYMFQGEIGLWIIFTVSAYVAVTLFSNKLTLLNTVFAVLIFWIWTNFGTWLMSGMYTLNLAGLGQCYWMALPFLRASMVASLIWFMALVYTPAVLLCKTNRATNGLSSPVRLRSKQPGSYKNKLK